MHPRAALLALLAVLAGCMPEPTVGTRPGEAFPPRELARLEGGERIALPGPGMVVINVWATWCAPCRAEMQSLERLHRRVNREGVRVVGISVDNDRHLAAEFVRAQRLTFDNALEGAPALAAAPLAVVRLPTTFVVDARGVVLWREQSPRDWADEATVARLLALLRSGR